MERRLLEWLLENAVRDTKILFFHEFNLNETLIWMKLFGNLFFFSFYIRFAYVKQKRPDFIYCPVLGLYPGDTKKAVSL